MRRPERSSAATSSEDPQKTERAAQLKAAKQQYGREFRAASNYADRAAAAKRYLRAVGLDNDKAIVNYCSSKPEGYFDERQGKGHATATMHRVLRKMYRDARARITENQQGLPEARSVTMPPVNVEEAKPRPDSTAFLAANARAQRVQEQARQDRTGDDRETGDFLPQASEAANSGDYNPDDRPTGETAISFEQAAKQAAEARLAEEPDTGEIAIRIPDAPRNPRPVRTPGRGADGGVLDRLRQGLAEKAHTQESEQRDSAQLIRDVDAAFRLFAKEQRSTSLLSAMQPLRELAKLQVTGDLSDLARNELLAARRELDTFASSVGEDQIKMDAILRQVAPDLRALTEGLEANQDARDLAAGRDYRQTGMVGLEQIQRVEDSGSALAMTIQELHNTVVQWDGNNVVDAVARAAKSIQEYQNYVSERHLHDLQPVVDVLRRALQTPAMRERKWDAFRRDMRTIIGVVERASAE